MKKVLTIQDFSCGGKCSITVALPILSALGAECVAIPVSVLSTHTAFNEWVSFDLGDKIMPMAQHLKKAGFAFDAILTGYLGSKENIARAMEIIRLFGGGKTFVVVDPCFGDNGALYKGFDLDYVNEVQKLCGLADVILPNMTEAAFLTGGNYLSGGYSKKFLTRLLKDLSLLGAEVTVLKGVSLNDLDRTIGVVSYNKVSDKIKSYFHERVPEDFHGTGDIFAAVFTGERLRGETVRKSYIKAADFVVRTIKTTLRKENHNWYGVDFEKCIKTLLH